MDNEIGKNEIKAWNDAAYEWGSFVASDFLRQKVLTPAILGFFGDARGRMILDAGCGEGYLSRELEKMGAKVTGIDGSAKMIEVAKSKARKESEVNFSVQDLREELPFSDGVFGVVLASMVLMDFHPIDMAISEFRRVLSPGGIFVFSLPHPLFSAGELKKSFSEAAAREAPHYEVRDYIREFRSVKTICGITKPTAFYHRPLEFYFDLLQKNGFLVSALKEPVLREDAGVKKGSFFELCYSAPPFVVVRAVKI